MLLTQSNRRDLPAADGKNAPPVCDEDGNALQYKFRGGCTLLIDPELGEVRYAIGKNLRSTRRRSEHEAYLRDRLATLGADGVDRYRLRPKNGHKRTPPRVEPFALTHHGDEAGDDDYG